VVEAIGILGGGVLLLGLALSTTGLFGMLRRRDIFEQLHAAGLVTGPGVILVLLASLATASAEVATSGLLVVAFVLVTSSLSTHAIALAAWRRREATGMTRDASGRAESEPSPADAMTPRAMRVLVAHDGSAGADLAVRLVGTMPWPDGSVLSVIGAVEGDLPALSAFEPMTGPQEEQVELAAALRAAADGLQRPGLSVDVVVRGGSPATVIIDEAEAFRADLVVVGSRGLGGLRAALLGSAAAAVVDAAPCPVLVARTATVREALLATDGSEQSAAAADVVARWPIFDGVPIKVLSIATGVPQYGGIPGGTGMREHVEQARQQRVADAAAMTLLAAGRVASAHATTGDAAARIAGFAQAESIDLIVIGSRGRTGLRRALLGSVGRAVLFSATTSVLVVRPMR
jgi:monovalent cation/proton antiporter MnhG/PhaG subunit